MTADHPAALALQREATRLRVEADRLRGEAMAADRKAEQLEHRLAGLGLRSFYAGSLERVRVRS